MNAQVNKIAMQERREKQIHVTEHHQRNDGKLSFYIYAGGNWEVTDRKAECTKSDM